MFTLESVGTWEKAELTQTQTAVAQNSELCVLLLIALVVGPRLRPVVCAQSGSVGTDVDGRLGF